MSETYEAAYISFTVSFAIISIVLFNFIAWSKLKQSKDRVIEVKPSKTCTVRKNNDEDCENSVDSPVFSGKRGLLKTIRKLLIASIVLLFLNSFILWVQRRNYTNKKYKKPIYYFIGATGVLLIITGLMWLLGMRKLRDLNGKEVKFNHTATPFIQSIFGLIILLSSYFFIR